MFIKLSPELEAALQEASRLKGMSPEDVVLLALRERFLPRQLPFEPRDEWERSLLELGRDCGGSLSDEDVSSEGIYD